MPLTTSILFPAQTELDADALAEQSYQAQCADEAYEQSLTTLSNGIDSIAPLYIHRVPLVNHAKNMSMTLDVVTSTEAFTDIWRETCYLRSLYKLTGYTMNLEAEIEQLSTPF